MASRRLREIVEHRPKELRACVNGFELGRYCIESRRTQFDLAVNLEEPMAFVEILSEQDLCLLFFEVVPPPEGPVTQRVLAMLSDGRQLTGGITFAATWPTLRIAYDDPAWMDATVALDEAHPRARALDADGSVSHAPTATSPALVPAPIDDSAPQEATRSWRKGLLQLLVCGATRIRAGLAQRHFGRRLQLVLPRRSRAIATALAILLLAWLMLGTPSATWAAVERVGRALWQFITALVDDRAESSTLPDVAAPVLHRATPVRPPVALVPPAPTRVPRMTPAALAGLEVDLLSRLDEVGALVGEQVEVRRHGGAIVLEALVDHEDRKLQIVTALGAALDSPGLRVSVRTYAEAAAAQSDARGNASLRQIEIDGRRSAAYETLRQHLSPAAGATTGASTAASVDERIRWLATSALHRSQQALGHTWAITRLATRFEPLALEALNRAAYARWRALIGRHAQAFEADVEQLRLMLQPVFLPETVHTPHIVQRESDGSGRAGATRSLDETAQRLVALATEIDTQIRLALAATGRDDTGRLRTTEFWALVEESQRVASEIALPRD